MSSAKDIMKNTNYRDNEYVRNKLLESIAVSLEKLANEQSKTNAVLETIVKQQDSIDLSLKAISINTRVVLTRKAT